MKKIIFLFISLFFLGGCGQYNEINKLAFIDGIGIEKQDDTYHLYLAVVKEEKQETETTKKHTIYHVTGQSLEEAFQKGEMLHNKKAYYHHLTLMLLHSSLLENNQYQKLFPFLKDKLQQGDYLLLETPSPLSSILKQYQDPTDLKEFIRREQKESGTTTLLTFDDINAHDYDPEYSASIPSVILEDNTLKTNGMFLLGKDLTYNHSFSKISYLLSNQITEYYQTISLDQQSYFIHLLHLNCHISWKENTFSITITGSLESDELPKEKEKEAKKKIEEILEEEIKTFVQKEQTENVSTTPLKNILYLKLGKKQNLDEIYQTSKLDLKLSLSFQGGQS